MPALYSDLIEMYGDGPGRERFTPGINDKRSMRVEIETGQPQTPLPLGL
jgi:hypothetical protein